MNRLATALVFGFSLVGCKNDPPDYQDFLNEVAKTAPTPETKSCGDFRQDKDLSALNCCVAGELQQGLPATATLRDKEKSVGRGFVINSDLTGAAVFYFSFTSSVPRTDGFGNTTYERIEAHSIAVANCPKWVLEDDACNIREAIALSCPDLGEFRTVRD